MQTLTVNRLCCLLQNVKLSVGEQSLLCYVIRKVQIRLEHQNVVEKI